MKMYGNYLFTGATANPSFKDPNKIVYMAGFLDGLDSVKLYINEGDYNSLFNVPPLSKVEVEFDYNAYSRNLNFVSCRVLDAKKTA